MIISWSLFYFLCKKTYHFGPLHSDGTFLGDGFGELRRRVQRLLGRRVDATDEAWNFLNPKIKENIISSVF